MSRPSPLFAPRRLDAALVCGLLAACGAPSAPGPLRLDVPIAAADRGLVVATLGRDAQGGVELRALAALPIAPDGTIAPYVAALGPGAALRLVVLAYDAPLAELGLAAGPLSPVAVGAGRPLPTPRAAWTAEVAAGDPAAPAWSPAAGLGPLAEVRVAAVEPCGRFVEHAHLLPTDRSAGSVSRVSERGVLVVTAAEDERLELFYVERGGFARVEAPRGRIGQRIPFYVAYRDATGSVWFGTSLGGVWRGGLAPQGCDAAARPCRAIEATEAGILTRSDEVYAMSGPPAGEVTELYALTDEGSVERWDGHFTRVYDLSGEPNSSRRGAVARVGPGAAIFASERDPHVFRFSDGTLSEERLPADGPAAGVSAVAHVEGYGSLAGDRAGRLYAHLDGRWGRLQSETSTAGIRSLVPYGRGFVYTDEAGRVVEHQPGGPRCARVERPAGAPEAPALVSVVGRDLVVAGPAYGGGLRVRWLEAL